MLWLLLLLLHLTTTSWTSHCSECSYKQREFKWGLSVNKWSDVKCSDVEWTDVKWCEVKWCAVNWHDLCEVNWLSEVSEMKWCRVNWRDLCEVKWLSEVKWCGVNWRDLCEVILYWSEVQCSYGEVLGNKSTITWGWPCIEGTWLYCDYFIWCVSCNVFVLTCFVTCECVCVGFVMCGCFIIVWVFW